MTDGEIAAIDAELQALLAGDETRSSAALVSLGGRALERLLDVVAGRVLIPWKVSPREREEALAGAVAAFAERDVEPVLKGLEARGLQEGFTTVWALGCVVDARVVPLLLRSASSKDPIQRWLGVSGLARQRDARATEALIRALGDRALDVRTTAADALGEIGDPRAVDALEAALSSKYAQRYPSFARREKTALDKLRPAGRAGD